VLDCSERELDWDSATESSYDVESFRAGALPGDNQRLKFHRLRVNLDAVHAYIYGNWVKPD
jgi:hypothetical protein